jgi:DNA ligase (NAD+)
MVARLILYGLQLQLSEEALSNQTTQLEGLRFVVSGVFETVSRDELKALIDSNGGKVVSSISSKTSYVVAGANMGPSKRAKAENLKVPIISEQEFLTMID